MIPLPNVLLVGPTGSGKTTSIRTLVECGMEVFVVFTEPHMEMLSDLPMDRVHWHYITPTTAGWVAMLDKIHTIQQFQWEALAKMTSDPNKSRYDAWFHLVSNFANFQCQRCGQEFGDVTEWGHNRALVIDSLSGINQMAFEFICGGAIAHTQPQWGCAMDLELELIGRKLCYDMKCLYVVTSHLRRQFSELTGERLLLPHVLGSANSAEWPKNFNDVIVAQRRGTEFTWSTAALDVDCKGRNLPIADGLQPHFGPLLQNWWQRTQETGRAT